MEPLSENERTRVRRFAQIHKNRYPRIAPLILRLLAEPSGSPGPNVRGDAPLDGGQRAGARDAAHRLAGQRLDVLRALAAIGEVISSDLEDRGIGGRARGMRLNECGAMGWAERVYDEDGKLLLRPGPHGSSQQVWRITASSRCWP